MYSAPEVVMDESEKARLLLEQKAQQEYQYQAEQSPPQQHGQEASYPNAYAAASNSYNFYSPPQQQPGAAFAQHYSPAASGAAPISPRYPATVAGANLGNPARQPVGAPTYAAGFENVDISMSSATPYERVHDIVSVSNKAFQGFLDSTTPHYAARWLFFGFTLLVFMLRVIAVQGFFVVAYALGIYLLNIFLLFLSPKFDPAFAEDESGFDNDADLMDEGIPRLDEFRPFVRRLPEFKFWYNAIKAVIVSIFCTLFSFMDIPVFWPILLMYFVLLFALTMRRQIQHMIKYKYLPFDIGKKAYA